MRALVDRRGRKKVLEIPWALLAAQIYLVHITSSKIDAARFC